MAKSCATCPVQNGTLGKPNCMRVADILSAIPARGNERPTQTTCEAAVANYSAQVSGAGVGKL